MRVDVHAHYYPEKYVSCLAQFGKDTSHTAKAPGAGVTLDQRLDMLDRSGIRVQVLSVGAFQPYFASAEEATTAAKVANDLYAEVCKKYNGRFEAPSLTITPSRCSGWQIASRRLSTPAPMEYAVAV